MYYQNHDSTSITHHIVIMLGWRSALFHDAIDATQPTIQYGMVRSHTRAWRILFLTAQSASYSRAQARQAAAWCVVGS